MNAKGPFFFSICKWILKMWSSACNLLLLQFHVVHILKISFIWVHFVHLGRIPINKKEGSFAGWRYQCVRAIYNWKMRLRWCLVEYQQSSIQSVGLVWLAHTPVWKIESFSNYTRIENAHKVRKKISIFVLYRSPANF